MKRFTLGTALVAGCCLSAAFGAGFAIYLRPAVASRNSSGTMSAVNGPYVAGQVITASLFNNRLLDIENEITNSADRSGRGGFLAPVRGIDGTLAAPSLSFTSETGSGLFRNGAGDLRMALLGANVEQWAAAGPFVPSGKTFGAGAASPHVTSPLFSIGAGFSFTAQSRSGVDVRLGSNIFFNGSNDVYNAAGFAGYLQMPSQGGDFVLYTAPSGSAAATATLTERFRVANAGGITIAAPGVLTGIPADGSGFKHKRFGSLCTTAAASLAACTDALTWTTAFANSSYTVTCTASGIGLGAPFSAGITSKTASGFTHTTLSYGSTFGAQLSSVDCIAVHD